MNKPVYLIARARAFTGEGVRSHRVMVEGMSVRVYDSVAGHYTACHQLSARSMRRLVQLAQKAES